MKDWINRVSTGAPLTDQEVFSVVTELLSPRSSDEDKAAFLEALHRRGESAGEILAFAHAFLREAVPFEVPQECGPALDVCGTGGDRLGLFNVSTAVMFVAAGAGAKIVKHGNRGVTSKSGGADALEALGIRVDLPPERLQLMLEEAGATFLFAPRFHPAFQTVASARKILSARGSTSVFNMLGPLLNPAKPSRQLAGVFSLALVDVYAAALRGLGRERAWVLHGRAGDGVMDEISTLGPTHVADVSRDETRRFTLEASDLGVPHGNLAELRGGDAVSNARLLAGLLQGEITGAARDIVIVNSAAALIVAGASATWDEGMARSEESLDCGAASRVLATMRRIAG